MDAQPLLSIGMPVYNGEPYLEITLESLQKQTFEDFEVIFSDNASTDRTPEICQDYLASDPRFRYYRNDDNLGASMNYNQVFGHARGKYFKWAAHDDLLAPTFMEKCIRVLEGDSEIILCFSRAGRIDENGEATGTLDNYEMRVNSPSRVERFHDLVLFNHHVIAVFGVMRKDILQQTPLIQNFIGSDRILVCEMSLMGPFFQIPEYLFYRRDHQHTSVREYRPHERLAWFDPRRAGQVALPHWRKGFEYLRSISHVQMSWKERVACVRIVLSWFRKNRRRLSKDLRIASAHVLTGFRS